MMDIRTDYLFSEMNLSFTITLIPYNPEYVLHDEKSVKQIGTDFSIWDENRDKLEMTIPPERFQDFHEKLMIEASLGYDRAKSLLIEAFWGSQRGLDWDMVDKAREEMALAGGLLERARSKCVTLGWAAAEIAELTATASFTRTLEPPPKETQSAEVVP